MIFFVLFWVQESSPSHLYHELRTILYINGNFRLLPVHFVPSYFRLNAHDPHCAPLHRDNRILSRGQRLYRALLPNLCKWISATSRSIERLPKYKNKYYTEIRNKIRINSLYRLWPYDRYFIFNNYLWRYSKNEHTKYTKIPIEAYLLSYKQFKLHFFLSYK